MKRRDDLHEVLVNISPDCTVYFQPPSNIYMSYPAIRYKLSNIGNRHADNSVYIQQNTYEVTVIDHDPDSEISEAVSRIPGCRFVRSYEADGLNHFVYEIYDF